jgi:hypothetical protein
MKNYTFEDKIDTRINELDSPLNDLSVGNIKKTKINLEKSSLKSTLSVSTQFKEVVAKVLEKSNKILCEICLKWHK